MCVLRQVADDPILPLEYVRLTLLPNISGVAGLHVNSAGNCRYKNYPYGRDGRVNIFRGETTAIYEVQPGEEP